MTTPTLLLVGPIGVPNRAVTERFGAAAKDLRARGYRVVDPTHHGEYRPHNGCEHCPPAWRYWQAVMAGQLGQAAGVALLPGWFSDAGCCQVVDMAGWLGLRVDPVDTWMLRAVAPAGGTVAT